MLQKYQNLRPNQEQLLCLTATSLKRVNASKRKHLPLLYQCQGAEKLKSLDFPPSLLKQAVKGASRLEIQ